MNWQRVLIFLVLNCAVIDGGLALPDQASPVSRPPAAARLSEPGPEDRELSEKAGTWKVTSTLRLTPDATPIVTKDLIVERKMVGPYLEEVMQLAPGSQEKPFRRIAYLTYFRVEGRYQYVSLDTRFPVGIMPAWSYQKPIKGKLILQFAPFTFVGLGQEVEGRSIISDLVLTRESADHDVLEQNWIRADGTGKQWKAVEYDYQRVRSPPSTYSGR